MSEITVRGKNMKVDAPMRALSQEKVAKLDRFTHDVTRCEVDFSKIRNASEPDNQLCEITLHLKRHFVKAHAAAPEVMTALDLAIAKAEHQLSRLKDKRVSRRRRIHHHVAPPIDDAPLDFADEPDEPAEIVKTKKFQAKPMTPTEAGLQMGLLGHTFYLFANIETGHAAVIYRRRDGHLGLIEAAE
ncbi:MAG TPA: ribosome-associated translation inhibitor RaiA [Acidimicrobiia bacterium]|nr:ribosome-associated translation inhibitor RaiA [Acidimicrobiia bacterium]